MTTTEDSSDLLSGHDALTGAQAVARGVARMFLRHDILVLPEVSLRNKRRADLMGIDAKGQIVIVEIKVARSDLLGDGKWMEYLDYCDRFYWALPIGFDASPVYDAEMVRPAATNALAPARRKTETMRLARRAMRRAAVSDGWISPDSALHQFGG